jgi:hypothetical protein
LVATDTSGATKISSALTVTTLVPAISAGLVPTFGSPTALNNYTSYTVQITNYNSAFTWNASASAGNASISNTGLVTVSSWPEATSSTLTVSTSRIGYQNGSASIVANCDLSPLIQAQDITATLSGSTLTVNVPNPRGWSWSVIWDGTVQRTGITSFPLTITGFATNKNIQLAAIDSTSNYGYSRVFLPSVAVAPATMWKDSYALNGTVIGPGRGGVWEIGISNATSLRLTASSPDAPSIVSNFSQSWGGNVVISTASYAGEPGKLLYQGAIYVPSGTPNTTFTLTWTATNSAGVSTTFSGGTFTTN